MKKTTLTLGLLIIGLIGFGQTNRINHYSHSGSAATLNIFKSNDNMGLGCGAPVYKEYIPDSVKIDTTQKYKTEPIPEPPKTTDHLRAIESRIDTSSVYNRGRK